MGEQFSRRDSGFLLIALLLFVAEAMWSSVGRGAVRGTEAVVAAVVFAIVAYLCVNRGAPTGRLARIVAAVLGVGLSTLTFAWLLRFVHPAVGGALAWAALAAVVVVASACFLMSRFGRKSVEPAGPAVKSPKVGSGWCRRWRVMLLMAVAYGAGRKG